MLNEKVSHAVVTTRNGMLGRVNTSRVNSLLIIFPSGDADKCILNGIFPPG